MKKRKGLPTRMWITPIFFDRLRRKSSRNQKTQELKPSRIDYCGRKPDTEPNLP